MPLDGSDMLLERASKLRLSLIDLFFYFVAVSLYEVGGQIAVAFDDLDGLACNYADDAGMKPLREITGDRK